jgi:PAS domain S-box-containing protein
LWDRQSQLVEEQIAQTNHALPAYHGDQSPDAFRDLVEISVDAVVIAGPDGLIRYVNPAYERLIGYTAEELVGQPFFPLMHPDDVELVQQLLAQL